MYQGGVPTQRWSPIPVQVLTTLENLEISGNVLILENSGNLKFSHRIYQVLAVFYDTI